jgi:hypothetical protein
VKRRGQAKRKPDPKFKVGDRVWSRQHERMVEIRSIVWDDQFWTWGYFFRGLPMYWLEYNLRAKGPKK